MLLREMMLPGQLDDLRAALRLVSVPTMVRVQSPGRAVLGPDARGPHQRNRPGRRWAWCPRPELGDEEHQAEALLARAAVQARGGESTRAELEAAREAAVRIDSARLEVWAYLPDLTSRGRRHRPPAALVRPGL